MKRKPYFLSKTFVQFIYQCPIKIVADEASWQNFFFSVHASIELGICIYDQIFLSLSG